MKAVTSEQMRALDQAAIAAGISGATLMERAGLAVGRHAAELTRRAGRATVLLLAGKGNNGGDAIVAARHLAAAGCETTLALTGRGEELRGDPLTHFRKLLHVRVVENADGATVTTLLRETAPAVVVDGLLGTGLREAAREPVAGIIDAVNAWGGTVLAIDVPSGLDADSGAVPGAAVRATLTVTLALPKLGLLRAPEHVGRLTVADIGIPLSLAAAVTSDVEWLTAADVAGWLPKRRRDAHKGDHGHLLIIAGSEGYTGAAVLCAHAAARSGVGLVTLAVPREVYGIVAAQCPPEVMPRPLDRLESVNDFDAMALGPGMGREEAAQRQILEWLDGCRKPVVVDADGLNTLARNLSVLNRLATPLVLTPHPGEMGRLTGQSAADVQARRWEVAREFAERHGLTLVLKGAGTVVAAPQEPLWVNTTGNPGMAKGGMGDALTGIIGALLTQGVPASAAARAGVFLHGRAGDLAADRVGQPALLASDLIAHLGTAWKQTQRE